ncbi:MAG: cysteine hydrolase family protein [Christensenellales bacterium]|jgi:nicotinamidase-related amidase
MKKALLIIDYTYDFIADDGKLTCGKPGQDIDGAIVERIKQYEASKEPIFVLRDLHYEGDTAHPESKLFPPHNIFGTAGREVYGETRKVLEELNRERPEQVFWMDKTRYSSFARTDLADRLNRLNVDAVELTGVCTDICILHTAISAYNLGFDVIIPQNAVASFSPEGHTFALGHMKDCLGAELV